MYGLSNVADGWAGAANTYPHPMPHPTPFPTQTPAQKGSKTLIFPYSDSGSVKWSDLPTNRLPNERTNQQIDQPMNGRTNRRTDGPTGGRTKPIELRVRN